MFKATERAIFSDVPLKQDQSAPSNFIALTLGLRKIRDRLPREKILKDLRESCLESARRMAEQVEGLNAALLTHLCHSRVFCVSVRNDNVVMWSHYAEEHEGVAFRLKCDDALDNRLLAARAVEYTDQFLPFPSPQDYAKHLTGEQPIDMVALSWRFAYMKHDDWAYEREWRVHMPLLDQPAGDGYSIFEEDKQIFEAISLGCRMTEKDAAQIVAAVRKHLPKTKIYRAQKSTQAFSLEMTELD